MNWTVVGALLGFAAVAAGAFGAHGLRGYLPSERLEVFETAVRYQMYHSLALILSAGLGARKAAIAFFIGILIFSGSLYLLVITGKGWLGAITPLGGISLLTGWILLAIGARQ